MYVVYKKLTKEYFREKDVQFMIKEIKGNTKQEHYGDSFIVRIPDDIIDLLILENNQKFLISIQGESIVLTPEVTQPNTFSNWENGFIRHQELDWGEIKENEGKY